MYYESHRYSGNQSTTVPRDIVLPEIIMPYEVWCKMQAYVQAADPHEVSGLGLVQRMRGDKVWTFMVYDVFILAQDVNAGHAEIDPAALHAYAADFLSSGGDLGELIFQWHSHVKGGTSPSPTDINTIHGWTGDTLISCITNIYGDHGTRIDWFQPDLRFGMNVEMKIDRPPLPAGIQEQARLEYEALARKPKPPKPARAWRKPKAAPATTAKPQVLTVTASATVRQASTPASAALIAPGDEEMALPAGLYMSTSLVAPD